MRRVDAEHALELAPVDDQDPVEALAPQRADPALGIGVGVWGSDWRPDDREAGSGGTVRGRRAASIGSGLLRDPAAVGVARACDELDASALERDEEEDVDAREPYRLDGEEVAGQQRRRLLVQELSPAGAVA